MSRNKLKAGAARLLYKTGLYKLVGSLNGMRKLPAVIGYHKVVESFASSRETAIPSMLVSAQMFERHLDWLASRYRIVDLDELAARLESEEDLPKLAAITFDDGYADFYDLALPILQRKGIPAAVFVMTEFVGAGKIPDHDRLYLLLARRIGRRALPQWQGISAPNIDRMTAYQATRAVIETLPNMAIQQVIQTLEREDDLSDALLRPFRLLDWEQLRKIRRAGITIGSHTRSHIILTNESRDRVHEELRGSRADLEEQLGESIEHFVYPSGVFDLDSVQCVASAGYRFAYTGCTHRSTEYPLLTLPRAVLWENSSLNSDHVFSGSVLSCQIHHAFDLPGRCRARHVAAT